MRAAADRRHQVVCPSAGIGAVEQAPMDCSNTPATTVTGACAQVATTESPPTGGRSRSAAAAPVGAASGSGWEPWEALNVPRHAEHAICCKYVVADYHSRRLRKNEYSCTCNAACSRPPADPLLALAATGHCVVDTVPKSNGWWPAYCPLTPVVPRAERRAPQQQPPSSTTFAAAVRHPQLPAVVSAGEAGGLPLPT